MIPNYLVLDIENNNSNQYGRTAGNFLLDPIVAIAMVNSTELSSKYIYPEKLTDLEIDEDILVGHNIIHDLLFLWHLPGIQKFFARGGRIWDTATVEYMLTGQQHKYPALREIAVNKYGCPKREKQIEKFLFEKDRPQMYKDKYKQVSDLPREVVIQDVEQDVLDTKQVFLQQYKMCEERGLLPLVEVDMLAELATIEMTYNGFKIDRQRLIENRQKAQTELLQLVQQLDELCTQYWSFWPKEIVLHKAAIEQIEGACMGPKEKVVSGYRKRKTLEKFKFNPNSGDQLSILLFNIFNIEPLDEWKRDKEGFYKVNEDVLQEIIKALDQDYQNDTIKDAIKIIELILSTRHLKKMISTYYDSTEELIYKIDDAIHANFNLTATDTGRMSCNKPNIQNQSNGMVLEHFVSRYE